MPVIKVAKSFLLPTEDGAMLHYEPGEYEVDEATADHWFVKAHLEGFVDPPPTIGTMRYAQAMLNAEQAVRHDQPMGETNQPRAPLPPGTVSVAPRFGSVPEGSRYFAGGPRVDGTLPPEEPVASRISFLGGPQPHREA